MPALKPQRLQLGLQGWQAQSTAMQIMTAVGFEPTQLALVELESTPLDHSGKLSLTLSSVGSLDPFSFFTRDLRSGILRQLEDQACC